MRQIHQKVQVVAVGVAHRGKRLAGLVKVAFLGQQHSQAVGRVHVVVVGRERVSVKLRRVLALHIDLSGRTRKVPTDAVPAPTARRRPCPEEISAGRT